VKRAALVPWLVALAVFGPFVAALLLNYLPGDLDWLPQLPGSRELLDPPLPAPTGWLEPASEAGARRYPWFLIYAKMSRCDRPCAATLERLGQVHAALAGDADRVRRVFWYAGAAPDLPADRDLELRNVDGSSGESTVRALGADRLDGGRIYVADRSNSQAIFTGTIGCDLERLAGACAGIDLVVVGCDLAAVRIEHRDVH